MAEGEYQRTPQSGVTMNTLLHMTFRRAVSCFLAGILTILPLVITVAVVIWVADFVRRLLGPKTLLGEAIRGLGLTLASDQTLAYVIGAGRVLAAVFVIGVAVESGARNLVRRVPDLLLQRIPIVGSVYGTSKQLVAMLDKKEGDGVKGMKVVFCFFGQDNNAGVLALLASPQRFLINGRQYQIVVIPTAPMPIGGGLLFVPVEMLRPADVSVEALMSIYVSMGMTAPQFLQTAPPHAPPA